jgi:site-specific recombinase XerD
MTKSEERRHGKLKLYRRHLSSCVHRSKGRAFDSCKCPIWIQGTWKGERRREALGVDTWAAAEKIKRNIEDGVEIKKEESKEESRGITIKDALSAYISASEVNDLSAGTLKKYRRLESRLTAYAERERVGDLASFNLTHIERYRAQWKLSALTAQKEIGFLRAFFTFCIRHDWIEKNPAKLIKTPKLKDAPRIPFSEKEIQNILSQGQDDRELAFLMVLRHTGLRIGDASFLKVSQVSDGRIYLYTAKSGAPVSVLIPETLASLLKKLPASGGYFFIRGDSTHQHTVSDLWRKRIKAICKTLEIKPDHPHRFRHFLAADLLSRGVSVENVAAILGNSPAVVIKHYSQFVKTRQDALDAALKATWQPALVRVK